MSPEMGRNRMSEQKNLIEAHAEKIRAIKTEVAKVVVGQEEMIHLMIYTLFSKGHILLEGVPGLAKSLAVETFAKVVGGDFNRFQFTPDKMPSDITGTVVWNERDKKFDFFFSQFILFNTYPVVNIRVRRLGNGAGNRHR